MLHAICLAALQPAASTHTIRGSPGNKRCCIAAQRVLQDRNSERPRSPRHAHVGKLSSPKPYNGLECKSEIAFNRDSKLYHLARIPPDLSLFNRTFIHCRARLIPCHSAPLTSRLHRAFLASLTAPHNHRFAPFLFSKRTTTRHATTIAHIKKHQPLSSETLQQTDQQSTADSGPTAQSNMPQARSQAQHQAETATDPAVVSPLTKLLSQYALLTSVCQHLSSADVVHLGQTSREHWQYIGASPATLRILIALTVCGGQGIQARAAVFGHWRGDAAQGAALCRGKEAKPCADCGAKVCNVR